MCTLLAGDCRLETVAVQKVSETHFLMALEVAWEVDVSDVHQIENLELLWTVNKEKSEGEFLV